MLQRVSCWIALCSQLREGESTEDPGSGPNSGCTFAGTAQTLMLRAAEVRKLLWARRPHLQAGYLPLPLCQMVLVVVVVAVVVLGSIRPLRVAPQVLPIPPFYLGPSASKLLQASLASWFYQPSFGRYGPRSRSFSQAAVGKHADILATITTAQQRLIGISLALPARGCTVYELWGTWAKQDLCGWRALTPSEHALHQGLPFTSRFGALPPIAPTRQDASSV